MESRTLAVGHSVAWYRGYHSADPVDSYDKWFSRLGKAKGNCARVFMWAHCLGFEWGKPGQYRLDSAWEMDYVMKLAEEHGIYVKLCLEAWRSFHGLGSLVPTCLPHPYCSKNGGPCETEKDFFTHPEAKRMFRNRLRYLVARWGYSTHIMAWELWNEINCVHGYRAPSGKPSHNVADWTAEMARYLREIDPWRHMVVNSLGTWVADGDRPAAEHEQMWNIPEMDFAQAHLYWKPVNQKREEIGKDMGECVPHVIGTIRHYGKPVVVNEYGLTNKDWGKPSKIDRDGVHLHNGLWSSVMSEAAGTTLVWWWEWYVDPLNLYYHYTSVADFVEEVPWTTAGFKPATLSTNSPQVRALGLHGKDQVLLWIQNRRHTWWNVVEKQPIGEIGVGAVTVNGLDKGTYEVEWWDTWKGVVTKRETRHVQQGRLSLDVAGLKRDVAVKITRR